MQLLILGGNSDIGLALAAKFAQEEGADVVLASRATPQLENRAKDLGIRYQTRVTAFPFDAVDYASHQAFYDGLSPKPDGVILAFGYLGDQGLAQRDFRERKKIIATNFLGAASILEIVAADFEVRKQGFIIGISSVAGERGRQSNYAYGAAKGALSLYLSGLRNRLSKSDVKVITVLPGFVRTKMTEGLKLPAKLTASPDKVASDVYRAYKSKKDVVYTKRIWKLIMLIIRNVPERIFKKLNL